MGQELKTVSIDSHNDVVSRIEEQSPMGMAMTDNKIIGCGYKREQSNRAVVGRVEVLEFFLVLGGQTL